MSYAKEIVAELCKRGDFFSTDLFGAKYPIAQDEKEAAQRIGYIPEDNLERVYKCMPAIIKQMKEPYTVEQFLHVAAKQGYLSFTPYTSIDCHGYPSLVLKYNRFAHLFRGMHYQVSYTAEGIGEYQSNSIRLDALRKMFKCCPETDVSQCLQYMNLIAACFGIDPFMNTLSKSPEIIDDFIRQSLSDEIKGYNLTYADLREKAILNRSNPEHKEAIDAAKWQGPEFIYRIPASDTMDFCRLNVYHVDVFGNRCVGVEYGVDGSIVETMFKLPDFSDEDIKQLQEYFDDEDKGGIAEEYVISVYTSRSVFCSLVVFALNTCGVACNFMVAYRAYNAAERIKAINRPDVITLDKLDVIYDADYLHA